MKQYELSDEHMESVFDRCSKNRRGQVFEIPFSAFLKHATHDFIAY